MTPAAAFLLLLLFLLVLTAALWRTFAAFPDTDAFRRRPSHAAQRLIEARGAPTERRLTEAELDLDRRFHASLTGLLTLNDDDGVH